MRQKKILRGLSVKKYVFLFLTAFILCFIWHNSLQPANLSEQQSLAFARFARYDLQRIAGFGFSLHEVDNIVRKVAHIMEFAMLGYVVSCAVRQFRLRCSWMILPLLLGLLAACIDEYLQQFSPGRAMQLSDVGIDFIGVCLGHGVAAKFFVK